MEFWNNSAYLNAAGYVYPLFQEDGAGTRQSSPSFSIKTSDYNLFYNYTVNQFARINWVNYASNLSQWQTKSGYDINSQETNPLFIDIASGNFKLQAISPAKNAGIDRQDYDNDGNTTERINMGAYITDAETIGYASTVNPDTQAPTTPTNLTATPVSSSQINLSWTASTDDVGVIGYRVERCQGSICINFTQISTPTGTSYSDTGLTADTIYRYQVRAVDAAENLSGYSSIANAATQAQTLVFENFDDQQYAGPLTFYNVTGYNQNIIYDSANDRNGNGYSLRWDHTQGSAGVGYLQNFASYVSDGVYIRYWVKYASDYYFPGDEGQFENLKMFKLAGGLDQDIEMIYKNTSGGPKALQVYWLNSSGGLGGTGTGSVSLNQTMNKGAWNKIEIYVKIANPSTVHVTVNDKEVYYNNNADIKLPAATYTGTNQFMSLRASNQPSVGHGTWYSDDVTIVYNGGDLSNSEPQEPSGSIDTESPSIPTNLTATAVSSSQINLSWTASTDNVGVAGYRIYRCQGAGCTPSTQIATSTTNSYSNTGLSHSTTYVYTVAAYDAAGNVSGQSSSASATTQALIPGQPQISGVSGTINDGSTITINGNGFGTNGPTIVIFDNFENGTNGSNIKIGPDSATIGKWDITGNGGNDPKYSNSHALSGTLAFRGDATKQYGSGPESVSVAGRYMTATSDIFVSYWYYFPSTSDWPCYNNTNCNNKMVWITGINSVVDDRVIPASMPTDKNTNIDYAMFGNGAINSTYFTPFDMSKGKWHRFWVYLHGEGNANDHEELWVASPSSEANISVTRKVDRSSQIWPSGFAGFKRAWVNAYQRWCNDCSESAPTFDDVYIATGVGARARVEIGDAATYATSKNLTIATVTSWSDTSITATIRQGSFPDGQTAYLYVVDENGSVNANGYPITIGLIPDTTAPSIPTNLTVSAISSYQINLSWTGSTDNVGIAGYKIYRNVSLLTTHNSQLTTFSDTGLIPSTTYAYTVSAYDAAGNESAKSSAVSATTKAPADTTPPARPQGFRIK